MDVETKCCRVSVDGSFHGWFISLVFSTLRHWMSNDRSKEGVVMMDWLKCGRNSFEKLMIHDTKAEEVSIVTMDEGRVQKNEWEKEREMDISSDGLLSLGVDSLKNDVTDGVRFDRGGDSMEMTEVCSDDCRSDTSIDLLESSCVGKQVVPVQLADFAVCTNVIDLTASDDEIDGEDLVWGSEASVADIEQINRMLRTGAGVYGSVNSKLVVKKSLLEGAGRGVFVKEGCVIRDGECITQYSGRTVRSIRGLSVKEQLRTVEIDKIFVVGREKLMEGDGFGSLVNSSVVGRTLSFCRFVSYRNSVYIMAYCKKPEYPLCGLMELYLTAGSGWWSLFNSVRGRG